ncbi:MAG: O-antigen ligase family protein [Pseudomonadota bacterium]
MNRLAALFDKPTAFFRRPSSVTVMSLWVAMPVFGKPLGLVFLLLVPFCRDRSGPVLRSLRMLFFLSVVYALYIAVRSVLAGPRASEPILDTLPLLIVTGMALWAIRTPLSINIQLLFQATCIMLAAVFVLAWGERIFFGVWRPELLLGNPLNLAPVLLVPALFVTMTRFAPSRLWVWFGLAAFAMAIYVIGGLSQSRGFFVGLWALVAVRVGFELLAPIDIWSKLKNSLRVLITIGLVTAVIGSDSQLSGRYTMMAKTLTSSQAEPEWSVGLRMKMLKGGWTAVQERPFVGHGPQNRYNSAAAHFDTTGHVRFSHLHNDFLTHAVGGGILLVFLLIALIIIPAVIGFRDNRNLTPLSAHARREIGVLGSLAVAGAAAVNNIFFVDISAFTTALSLVGLVLILAAIEQGGTTNGTV